MLKKVTSLSSAAVLAAGLILVSGSAASAATTEDSGSDPSIGLYAAELNESVANANGFKIVTNPDGSKMSVPDTPETIAVYEELGINPEDRKVYPDSLEMLREDASAPGDVQARDRDVKSGWCGFSFLDGEKGGGNVLYVTTGFDVILPTTAGTWTVLGTAVIAGGMFANWNVGATGGTWERSADSIAIGPGTVSVVPTSNVTLTNGEVCYSMSPGVGFD